MGFDLNNKYDKLQLKLLFQNDFYLYITFQVIYVIKMIFFFNIVDNLYMDITHQEIGKKYNLFASMTWKDGFKELHIFIISLIVNNYHIQNENKEENKKERGRVGYSKTDTFIQEKSDFLKIAKLIYIIISIVLITHEKPGHWHCLKTQPFFLVWIFMSQKSNKTTIIKVFIVSKLKLFSA